MMEAQKSGWHISAGDDNDTVDKSKVKRTKKRSFIKALESKYSQLADVEQLKYCKIVFHGKPKSDEKSELGFLRNVVLTDLNIAVSGLADRSLRDVCPHVVDLDISGNLFDNWKSVLTIVSQLDSLKYLNVSRNPLKLGKKSLEEWTDILPSIENLVLNSTDIPWTDVRKLTEIFQNLKELHICGNGYSEIPDGEHSGMDSVETLRLNNNKFESWEQIWKLKHLPKLKSLILSGNPLQDVYFHENCHDRENSKLGQSGTKPGQTRTTISSTQQKEKNDGNLVFNTHCHGHGETGDSTTNIDIDYGQDRLNEGSEMYEECRNILEVLISGIHDNQNNSVQGNIHEDKDGSLEQSVKSPGGLESHININAQINVCDNDNNQCNTVDVCDSVVCTQNFTNQAENQNVFCTEAKGSVQREGNVLNAPETNKVADEETNIYNSKKFWDGTISKTCEASNPTNQRITIGDIKDYNGKNLTEDTENNLKNRYDVNDINKDIDTGIPDDDGENVRAQRSNVTNQTETENNKISSGQENAVDNGVGNETDLIDSKDSPSESPIYENNQQRPFENLENICLSETKIGKWKHLTALSAFPALVSIRIKDIKLGARLTQEDRRKLFVPCLPKIKVLNGSEVTATERDKGERYFLRYFCDKPKKPHVYSTLEKKHGTLTPLLDIDISRGYQEFVTLTFVFEGQEVFKETVSVRQPVGKLRLIIAANLSLYASLKNIKMFHKYCNPEHQSDLLYTGELEQLVLDTLPISRFDIMDGDEIHVDLSDKFTSGTLTPLLDIDISRGYQEFVTLTFVFEGQEVFKETVSVRQPVGKLRLIIAANLSLYASLKNIKMFHKYCNPEHQSDLLYTGELEQLVLDTLPISRFDIMDGDEIHVDLSDKFTSGAFKYLYVRNYLPKKKELLDELKYM